MNHGPLLFLGIFFATACSWYALVFKPHLDIGRQQPVTIPETGQIYPIARGGTAVQGLEVYRANGCAYCHTMQVRGPGFGSDIDRGWGKRPSVAQDFLYDQRVMPGSIRIGPDLMNIGARNQSAEWHLLHLYDPQITSKGSTMPPYRYLFERKRVGHRPSPKALKLPPEFAPEAGFEIVPTPQAEALVDYLLSLQAETSLFEAPLPPSTNAPASTASTNAVPATNAPVSTNK